MKKILALLLALAMVLSLAACGKKNEEQPEKGNDSVNSQVSENNPEETKAPVASGEITMAALMAAPESPVEDFEVVDFGSAGIFLEGYLGDDEIVVIPESLGITHIAQYTFANKSCVKAIRMSDSIQVLEEHAFGLNENLQLVVCGSGLKEIGLAAFQSCYNLREIKLNDGLESVQRYALSDIDAMTSVEIPASVTEIDYAAFYSAVEDFVIIGEAGSYAEQFAAEQGYPFQAK